ncbi:diguanylate cyclase [Myxococcaceae bacterium GXIMD 01537]
MALGPDTVGRKLLWSIALPGLIVALLGVGYFWRETRLAVRETTHREALALAEFVASAFALPQAEGAPPHGALVEVMGSDTRLFRPLRELRVLTPDGRIRWSRQREEEGRAHPEAARLTVPAPETARSNEHGTEVVRPLGGPECASCHVGDSAQRLGVLHVRLSEPALQQQLTGVFSHALLAVLVLAGIIAVATALSLNLFLTRPLRKLSGAMRRAEAGDFLVRAEARGTDEIAQLGAAFNQMLARLTSMKVEEIDTHRDLALVKEKLALREQVEAHIGELQLLFEVAHSLNSTLELSELLERITRLVVERLQIPDFSIMLVNADGLLEVRTAWPADRGLEGLTFAIGEGACGRAAQSQKTVYLPDLKDPSCVFARRGLVSGEDEGSLISVPMMHMDTLLGVINFQRPDVAAFNPGELELLTAVTEQAAMAVKNARLHAEAITLTMTDPLTGVPNRRHLFSKLEQELARAHRFSTQVSILMVDIDHFKRLNDVAGHRAGDETLRRVADLLRSRIRKVDTLARYGGEEFMLVLPQTNKVDAAEVAEKLRRAVAEATFLAVPNLPTGHVTISIGVSNFPVDAVDQGAVVDCADSALYASKRGGRNRVTAYETGMELHPGRERGPRPAVPSAEPPPSPSLPVAKA